MKCGKPLRHMLMRHTGQRTLARRDMAVPEDDSASWDFRPGDLDEAAIVTWLLASSWAFKRQDIKPTTQ